MTWWKGLILGVLALGVVAITVAGTEGPSTPGGRSPDGQGQKGHHLARGGGRGKNRIRHHRQNLLQPLGRPPAALRQGRRPGEKGHGAGQNRRPALPGPGQAGPGLRQLGQERHRQRSGGRRPLQQRAQAHQDAGRPRDVLDCGARLGQVQLRRRGGPPQLCPREVREQRRPLRAAGNQRRPHRAHLSHRRQRHRAHPRSGRAGARLGLQRRHRDDRGRAQQHGSED